MHGSRIRGCIIRRANAALISVNLCRVLMLSALRFLVSCLPPKNPYSASRCFSYRVPAGFRPDLEDRKPGAAQRQQRRPAVAAVRPPGRGRRLRLAGKVVKATTALMCSSTAAFRQMLFMGLRIQCLPHVTVWQHNIRTCRRKCHLAVLSAPAA